MFFWKFDISNSLLRTDYWTQGLGVQRLTPQIYNIPVTKNFAPIKMHHFIFKTKKILKSDPNGRDLGHEFAWFDQHHCSGCDTHIFAKLGSRSFTVHFIVHAKTRVIFLLQLKQKKFYAKHFSSSSTSRKKWSNCMNMFFTVTHVFFAGQAPNFDSGQVSVHARSVLFWFCSWTREKNLQNVFSSSNTSIKKWINCVNMVWL